MCLYEAFCKICNRRKKTIAWKTECRAWWRCWKLLRCSSLCMWQQMAQWQQQCGSFLCLLFFFLSGNQSVQRLWAPGEPTRHVARCSLSWGRDRESSDFSRATARHGRGRKNFLSKVVKKKAGTWGIIQARKTWSKTTDECSCLRFKPDKHTKTEICAYIQSSSLEDKGITMIFFKLTKEKRKRKMKAKAPKTWRNMLHLPCKAGFRHYQQIVGMMGNSFLFYNEVQMHYLFLSIKAVTLGKLPYLWLFFHIWHEYNRKHSS